MFTLPKSAKILRRGHFDKLFHQGQKASGRYVFLQYYFGSSVRPKLGITVTKKFGKSHDRNRFKRLVREVFRLHQSHFPPQLELNVRPKIHGNCPSFLALEQDILQVIQVLSKSRSSNV